MRMPAKILALAGLLMILGCAASGKPQVGGKPVVTVMGTVERVHAIGGETPGYLIRFDRETEVGGKRVPYVEVSAKDIGLDVFIGKRVVATGTLKEIRGVERKSYPVLDLSEIREEHQR